MYWCVWCIVSLSHEAAPFVAQRDSTVPLPCAPGADQWGAKDVPWSSLVSESQPQRFWAARLEPKDSRGKSRVRIDRHFEIFWDRVTAFWGFPVWRLLWSRENSSFEGACLYRSRFRHLGLGKRCSSLFTRLVNRQTPVAFSGRIHSLCLWLLWEWSRALFRRWGCA